MRNRPNLYLLPIVLLLLVSMAACNDEGTEKKSEIIEVPEQMDKAVARNLQQFLADLNNKSGKLDDSTQLHSLTDVYDFYKDNDYAGSWSKTEQLIPSADSMLAFIKQCRLYGLFPDDYHTRQLNTIRQLFIADTAAQNARRDAVLWTKADLLFTDAALTIVRHLHKGRLKPDSIYKNIDSANVAARYRSYLQKIIATGNITSLAAELEPEHEAYKNIRQSIPLFLDSADFSKRYTYLSYPYKDSATFVKSLIKRLREGGYVPFSTTTLDSSSLAAAITRVQKEKKLIVDGKFGVQLVGALNNTDAEKFIRIAINLDRYKLMPDTLPERYIWVNLPSYYLQVMDDDTVVLESKIVVGKPKTRTPLLSSTISDMITYPQWTIPNSIIIKEILPALKRNPGYLAKKGYSLLTWQGEEVDPYTVDWSKYSKGIPYKIVQGSGDDNALGVMKFNFPNKFSVYLHDTNQRYLFKNDNRALSHGCVRVQEWEKLVWYISGLDSVTAEQKNTVSLPSDSIRTWLFRKEKHIIPVKTKLPVYLRYFTVGTRKGKLQFYNDIYGEDRIAREAYFSNK
ncbi:MAG: L,D-transpeptidase family protein [Chitinophagaceae bacterium]|nr:L,D-transpeptidase family protein [Chitinophagaceae bacterium]